MGADAAIQERLARYTNPTDSSPSRPLTQRDRPTQAISIRLEQARQQRLVQERERVRSQTARPGGQIIGAPGQEYYEQLQQAARNARRRQAERQLSRLHRS